MGDRATLAEVPLVTPRQHAFALRAAADWDAVPGFLTLTGGYAWTSGGVAAVTPGLPDREAHTLAGGATWRSGGLSLVLGLAWRLPAEVATDVAATRVLAPLAEGAPPAAHGRLVGQGLRLGVAVEAAWPWAWHGRTPARRLAPRGGYLPGAGGWSAVFLTGGSSNSTHAP
jgi:hypothetical protein